MTPGRGGVGMGACISVGVGVGVRVGVGVCGSGARPGAAFPPRPRPRPRPRRVGVNCGVTHCFPERVFLAGGSISSSLSCIEAEAERRDSALSTSSTD